MRGDGRSDQTRDPAAAQPEVPGAAAAGEEQRDEESEATARTSESELDGAAHLTSPPVVETSAAGAGSAVVASAAPAGSDVDGSGASQAPVVPPYVARPPVDGAYGNGHVAMAGPPVPPGTPPPGYGPPPGGYLGPQQPWPPAPGYGQPLTGHVGPYPSAPPPSQPQPPKPPGRGGLPPLPVRTHRWGLGAYAACVVVFYAVGAAITYLISAYWGLTAGAILVLTAVPTLLAAGTALLFTWRRGNGPRVDLGLVWSWRDLGLGVAFGVSGLVLTIPASVVYISIVGPDATSAVGEAFGDLRAGPALAVVALIIVVFVAPLCEEILYRGLLWGAIERLGGRWWAFGGSTLLFTLAHFEYPRAYLLLVVSIPLALARLYTGRLLASIVAHQINNLLPGIVLMLALLGHVPLG